MSPNDDPSQGTCNCRQQRFLPVIAFMSFIYYDIYYAKYLIGKHDRDAVVAMRRDLVVEHLMMCINMVDKNDLFCYCRTAADAFAEWDCSTGLLLLFFESF